MLPRYKGFWTRPHLRLIALVGVIVPSRLRSDWRQEWEAELRYRELLLSDWERLDWRHRFDLLWRSTSAFWDALWLQQLRWEDEMFQDFRYGLRMLLKNPGFTAVVVMMLSLGVGANAALFSVVNGVLLNPLPYPQPEQMISLHQSKPNFPTGSIPYPNFLDLTSRETCEKYGIHTTASGAISMDSTSLTSPECPEEPSTPLCAGWKNPGMSTRNGKSRVSPRPSRAPSANITS